MVVDDPSELTRRTGLQPRDDGPEGTSYEPKVQCGLDPGTELRDTTVEWRKGDSTPDHVTGKGDSATTTSVGGTHRNPPLKQCLTEAKRGHGTGKSGCVPGTGVRRGERAERTGVPRRKEDGGVVSQSSIFLL